MKCFRLAETVRVRHILSTYETYGIIKERVVFIVLYIALKKISTYYIIGFRKVVRKMSEFGQLLKALRVEHKISQRKLADLIGIDFTYISKIESGSMAPPVEEKILKISEIFNVDYDELLIAAKKVPIDIQKIITEHQEVPMFLRKVSKLSPQQWERIQHIANETLEGGD
jgi:transcriptional regulator with XRE-family HTH domain